MGLYPEGNPGMQAPAPPEVQQTSVAIHEVILLPGEPVSLGKPRPDDKVGGPDFAVFAERSRLTPDALPVEELHGFDAYQRDGGVLSEGLYERIMVGVIKLQEPGAREKSIFPTPTDWRIKGFEDSHNRPFLGTPLPPEEQIFLTETQKDAYRVFRENLFIPAEDRQKGAYRSDALLFEEILIMPDLESYLLSKQEQPQDFAAAA